MNFVLAQDLFGFTCGNLVVLNLEWTWNEIRQSAYKIILKKCLNIFLIIKNIPSFNFDSYKISAYFFFPQSVSILVHALTQIQLTKKEKEVEMDDIEKKKIG